MHFARRTEAVYIFQSSISCPISVAEQVPRLRAQRLWTMHVARQRSARDGTSCGREGERSLKRHGGGSNCRDCSTPLSRFRLLEVAGNDRRATLRRASLRRKEGISCLPSSYPFSAQARLGPRWANLSSRLTALHFSGWRASSFPLRSNVDSSLRFAARGSPPRHAKRALGPWVCSSKEGFFSLLTRHSSLSAEARLGNVTGLLSVAPGGAGALRMRDCSVSPLEIMGFRLKPRVSACAARHVAGPEL